MGNKPIPPTIEEFTRAVIESCKVYGMRYELLIKPYLETEEGKEEIKMYYNEGCKMLKDGDITNNQFLGYQADVAADNINMLA